jgi:hypothetical protein
MFADGAELFALWRRQAALAGGFAAMGPAVGFVMSVRLARLALEAGRPSAVGAREAERMVSEKVSAAMEGGAAAARALAGLGPVLGPVAAASAMVAASEAALRPAERRLRANARRLSRRTRRTG